MPPPELRVGNEHVRYTKIAGRLGPRARPFSRRVGEECLGERLFSYLSRSLYLLNAASTALR